MCSYAYQGFALLQSNKSKQVIFHWMLLIYLILQPAERNLSVLVTAAVAAHLRTWPYCHCHSF
eukprot:2601002-Pleurochrysis_carterae.AAC.3